jgi:hypothetical protein
MPSPFGHRIGHGRCRINTAVHWYRRSQVHPPPDQWGVTQAMVEDMLRRLFHVTKEYWSEDDHGRHIPFQEAWREFYEERDSETLGLEAESHYEIWVRYIKNLPEGIQASDLIDAYRDHRLPTALPGNHPGTPAIEIPRGLTAQPWGVPGEPRPPMPRGDEQWRRLWGTARRRQAGEEAETIRQARYEIFLQACADPELAGQLGVKPGELTEQIRRWSNFPARARVLHQSLNRDRDWPVQWHGLINSSFLSRQQVRPQDLDSFVKRIEAEEDSGWHKVGGEPLRRYILRAFLGLDSRIRYHDLSFRVDHAIKPNGRYLRQERTIVIRAQEPNVLAHELGHYLDHKWAREAWGQEHLPSTTMADQLAPGIIGNASSPEREQWMRAFHRFVLDIAWRSDIGSEYLQDRSEVFARFTAKFVDWVNATAGSPSWQEDHRQDRFSEADFRRFVSLLQQKSYVDLADGNPLGSR